MGSCASAHIVKEQAEQEDEIKCSICYENKGCIMKLDCGHEAHAECLTRWWMSNRQQGLVCPICRGKSYGCYMELGENNDPVGYYRQDHEVHPAIMLRNMDFKDNSKFVSIEDIETRDLALNVFVYKLIRTYA